MRSGFWRRLYRIIRANVNHYRYRNKSCPIDRRLNKAIAKLEELASKAASESPLPKMLSEVYRKEKDIQQQLTSLTSLLEGRANDRKLPLVKDMMDKPYPRVISKSAAYGIPHKHLNRMLAEGSIIIGK